MGCGAFPPMICMKTDKPDEVPKGLSKALREWRVNTPLPPRFSVGVWQRIERREAVIGVTLWTLCQGWLATKVMRPVVALGYVAVLLFADRKSVV